MNNTLDKQYQTLLQTILDYGVDKSDRTGTGTKSIFGYTIRHNMEEGFPLLTTKKMAVKTMMTELKWFLKGDTNIKYLVDNGCNIWNGDAYKAYEKYAMANSYGVDILSMDEFINEIKTDNEFAKKWGELGPIYGKQWRDWEGFDQMDNLINQIKKNPDSRRLMVSAWNVPEIQFVVLPPCHYGFQCYVSEGKLSLMWNQRSVDTFLGLPFNIASYGTLLLLLCEETGYRPGDLIGNLGDVHLYSNHIEQAKEQLSREPAVQLPDIMLNNVDVLNGEFDYSILSYECHPPIKAPLSN
jgi:thymidylate synthase